MTPIPPIRVLIVDDHTIVRDGLRNILDNQDDITVVGERSNSVGIVQAVIDTGCNVLLMDLTMPGGSGLQGLNALKDADVAVHTLVLTVHDDPIRLQNAMRAGATGYLTKQVDAGRLLEAVRAVATGKTSFEILGTTTPALKQLSHREHQVLKLVALGYTNHEAAEHLQISPKSVEGYRRRMVQKIGAKSRADIVRFALDRGLLTERS